MSEVSLQQSPAHPKVQKRSPRWSVIIPTYRRPDVLQRCLEHLELAIAEPEQFEVLVYDNGAPEVSREVVVPFSSSMPVRYVENEPGHGFGYSVSRGVSEARGEFILEMNDDALIPSEIFERLESVFTSDPAIGVIGVRADEEGYVTEGEGIGHIDERSGQIVSNFHLPTESPVEVEHVYGFCYAYRREVLRRGGSHDKTLLAKDYSSGNRIETDQCLTARRLGFRVIYDGTTTVQHLAKPRGDMSEKSFKWKINQTRNTLYLYLKHFGPFGRKSLALRFALLHDLGLRSAILHPNRQNVAYFLTGVRARTSALWHWLKYLASGAA